MPSLRTSAIICSVRSHGEHGAVVRALTPENGLMSGYVRGAHSRLMRPILIPSNIIQADYRARTEDQLASMCDGMRDAHTGHGGAGNTFDGGRHQIKQ